MNKSDLVAALSEGEDLARRKAEEIVNLVFSEMTNALVDGDRVEILIGAGMLAGIGFTMSIFIAGLSFPTGPLVEVSKIGIISSSIISAILGLVTLTLMSRNRPGK